MLQLEICANVDASFGRAVLYRVGRGAALPLCTLHRDSATVAPLSLSLSLYKARRSFVSLNPISAQAQRKSAAQSLDGGRREKGRSALFRWRTGGGDVISGFFPFPVKVRNRATVSHSLIALPFSPLPALSRKLPTPWFVLLRDNGLCFSSHAQPPFSLLFVCVGFYFFELKLPSLGFHVIPHKSLISLLFELDFPRTETERNSLPETDRAFSLFFFIFILHRSPFPPLH